MELPSMSEWLLAQTHRDDSVGMLARLWVQGGTKNKEIDPWLTELTAGIVLAYAVADLTRDYAQAIHELRETGKTASHPRWMRNPKMRAIMDASWERHAARPEVPAQTYLHLLHLQQAMDLAARAKIYIDTCHWVRMREIVMGESRALPVYADILARLRALRAERRIVCPLSGPLLIEVARQSSDSTRLATARLVDELSGGACIQSPPQIQATELKQQLLRSTLGEGAPSAMHWIWTRPGWALGIALPEATAFDESDQRTITKVHIDQVWNMSFEDVMEAISEPPPVLEVEAAAHQKDWEFYRTGSWKFPQVREREVAFAARTLMQRSLTRIAQEVWEQFPEQSAQYAARKDGKNTGPNPQCLASVQILGAVNASFATTAKMKIKPSDLADAQHAAVALPYCNVLFIEGPMQHRLTKPPLRLDQTYNVRVISDSQEFLAYLDGIAKAA